jgi:hypothetical protein
MLTWKRLAGFHTLPQAQPQRFLYAAIPEARPARAWCGRPVWCLLAERMASRATETATPVKSKLDNIRDRRAARLTDAQDREPPGGSN